MRNIWSMLHKYLDKLSTPSNGNKFQRYGFVLVLLFIFYLIKALLITTLDVDVPFLFSLFAVIISAWVGGFGPGVLATLLAGGVTYYFFLDPRYTFLGHENIPNLIIIFVFFLEGLFISMMSESHRRNDLQKTEFIGVISHELKNPLTSIKGYSEMIQKKAGKNGESALSEYAVRINQQIKNVIFMINEMLDITKIETGRLSYYDEKFNITNLAYEIVKDQQVTTTTHKIEFRKTKDVLITGDRYRIGQVITNLINNAIKYAPDGKRVVVATESNKSNVTVSVKDFGPGIAKDDRLRVFDPFYRAKKTKSARGTGIGLFISSQIIARHKGKLWVVSKVGKGSVFFFRLPKN